MVDNFIPLRHIKNIILPSSFLCFENSNISYHILSRLLTMITKHKRFPWILILLHKTFDINILLFENIFIYPIVSIQRHRNPILFIKSLCLIFFYHTLILNLQIYHLNIIDGEFPYFIKTDFKKESRYKLNVFLSLVCEEKLFAFFNKLETSYPFLFCLWYSNEVPGGVREESLESRPQTARQVIILGGSSYI